MTTDSALVDKTHTRDVAMLAQKTLAKESTIICSHLQMSYNQTDALSLFVTLIKTAQG
jgi:hypothetical protein